MNPSRDKFIVEWFGGHQHEWTAYVNANGMRKLKCSTCDKQTTYGNTSQYTINFDTYEGFGELWEMMRKNKLAWRKFLVYLDNRSNMDAPFQVINLIDTPSKFADAVYNFLKGQVKE